jgi:hypothetical protein
MADSIDITIRSIFAAAGAQQAQKAVEALAAAVKSTSSMKPIDPGFTKTAADAQKAEQAALRYANSLASAQKAQGDLAGAVDTLRGAMSGLTENTVEYNNAAAKLAQTERQLAQSTQSTAQAAGGFADQLAGSVKAAFMGIVGPAAIATTAIAAVKGSFDLAQVGAQVQAVEQSFRSLSASYGQNADQLLAKLHEVSRGTVSDSQLMQQANTGLLLTSGKIASELPHLLEIARASARATGQDVGFMFQSLVLGISRGSAKIIDNTGVTIDGEAAFKKYAESIGKTADQLTKDEQQQATLNAVIAAGNDIIAKSGDSAGSNAEAFQRAGASWQNAKEGLGSLLSYGFVPILNSFSDMVEGFQRVGDAAAQFGQRQDAIYGVGQAATDAGNAAAASADGWTSGGGALDVMASAAQAADPILNALTMDEERHTAAVMSAIAQQQQQATVTQASADASLIDKAAKEAQTAQTDLLNQQTIMAAQSFMALNPGIDGSGVASAAAAGKISAAVAEYINMTLATARARAELALLQAQAGMSPALKAAVAANPGDVGRYISRPADAGAKAEGEAMAARIRQMQAQDAAQKAAQRDLQMAQANAQQRVAILQKEADDAKRIYGANSTEALKAQTALVNAQQSGAKARGGAASAGGAQLENIEQKTGDKLSDIVQKTQDKITAIDKRAAEEQAAAFKKLQEEIATTAADRRAKDEADDLDLIGVKDRDKARELNNRERAEATAREKEKAAQAEALASAQNGEAESAEKIYNIREQQIDAQQQLDEKYYARQAELAGDPKALAALQQQYDEATRAINEAADARIAIANAEAAAKKQAVEDEKAAVIAAANDEANSVISQAQRSAEGVKKASGDAKAKAVADLSAIGDAVNAIPTQKTITITVNQQGKVESSSAGSADTRAAGGGTFVTSGPITVGDNPGGKELVSVIPLSGTGVTTVGAGTTKLAGGGQVVVDAGDGYTTPVAGTGGGGGGGSSARGASGPRTVDMEAATKALQGQIAYYKAVAELANLTASPLPTLNAAAIQTLAADAQRVGAIVGAVLVPISKENSKLLDDYEKAVGGSVSILKDIQDLRKDLSEPQPPISAAYAQSLIDDNKAIARAVGGALVPIAYSAMIELENYEKAISGSTNILKDLADLRKSVAEPQPPISQEMIYRLAIEAQRVSNTVSSLLIPFSEEQGKQIDRYAQAVQGSTSALKSVTDLSGKLFADYQSPTDAQINLMARDANRVARAVATAAATYSADGLTAAKSFAESVGATFSAFKDGLIFFQAVESGDFNLNTANLDKFERATAQTMDVARRLGARAATIPKSDIAALQSVIAAQTALAESAIKLAAVPFGDLPGAGANASRLPLMSGGTTITNYFNLPQGTTQQLAQEVLRILNSQVGGRRYA